MKGNFQKRSAAKHYFEIYEKYSKIYDKIVVLYEFGKFYEMFGIDNEREKIGNINQVTKELGIRATRCSKKILNNSHSNPQQAGFPSPSLPDYLDKLIKFNYTVIIYSQFDDDRRRGKKIRKLDRIVSKGTYIPAKHSLKEENDTKNFIFIYVQELKGDVLDISISSIDVQTGSIECYPVIERRQECLYISSKIIHSLSPVEAILSSKNNKIEQELELDEKIVLHRNYMINKSVFQESYQDQFLKKIFPIKCSSVVDLFDLEHYGNLTISLVCLLQFVHGRDERILKKIQRPKIIDSTDFVRLSHRTVIQLNLVKSDDGRSLFDILNRTSTPMGKRMLRVRLLSPVHNVETLNKRYDEIDTLLEGELFVEIERSLESILDLERLNRLLFLKRLSPCDICSLDLSYIAVWEIYKLIRNTKISSYLKREKMLRLKRLVKYYRSIFVLKELSKCTIDVIETKIFKDGIFKDVDKEYSRMKTSWGLLTEYKDTLNNLLLKDGTVKICYTVINGYYLSTSEKKALFLRDNFEEKLEIKRQKSTTKIFSKRIRDISSQILDSKRRLNIVSKKHFEEILEIISSKYSNTMVSIASSIAHIDTIKSICKITNIYKYCRPTIADNYEGQSFVKTTKLRHPIVEVINQEERFIPYNIEIGGDSECGILLYGVNGIGKSLCLKSITIAIILAQSGFYVPAYSFSFYPFSNIITKISMTDNIYKNRSFFECEMIEMGKMLEKANPNTIIFADELCSGTETIGAISLVGSSIQQLTKKRANFVFTTHLHQLTDLPLVKRLLEQEMIKCLHMTIEIHNGKIIYKREFKKGQGPKTYGIEMARQLGVGDKEFIQNAIEIRRLLDPNIESEILTTKRSIYNRTLYMTECCKCGSKKDLQTHHKQEQKFADKYGMIGSLNKNNKSNLEVLCKQCHQKHHSSKQKG